ncbi:hypothetical protein ACM46_07175 [Chryseobacterium angstadtii]|uniref:Uncharacterized protein n=1 Tax=Chryseobacterium angstadtii TaxID=558151 RepID=A0A0J7IGX1_9FLAO|nr:hypothetical protein [Chryseobacterium angstadtii]KMQ65648.1 hypothetical protein ACM46_07175 [Chryseobacterium angstadtii]
MPVAKVKCLLILVFLCPANFFSQVNDDKIRSQVLQRNIVGKEYTFGQWSEKGGTETHLRYLGKVITGSGTYKILNSTWIWGLSHRATNRILVFDHDNKYLGNYYVTTDMDLPAELRKGFLIFKNTDRDCDSKIVTKIDMKNGIPAQFFRKCRADSGDIYSFSRIN